VGAPLPYVFSVAAGVSPAVEGGILPPGKNAWFFGDPQIAGRFGDMRQLAPPGRMPDSTAGGDARRYAAKRLPAAAAHSAAAAPSPPG